MGFRTKLDYSDNRQIKQREQTSTSLSGASTFGLAFSALTSGPDLEDIKIFDDGGFTGVTTFSGNNTVTLFDWADDRFSVLDGNDVFSALTPTTSAITQESGFYFEPNESTVIDGNLVNLSYTGVGLDITVTSFEDLGGTYSGTIIHDVVQFVTANTLDYTGRTIWVDNPEITRTDRLIVSRGAQNGYVLTSDDEGFASWQPNNGGTGSTVDVNNKIREITISLPSSTSSPNKQDVLDAINNSPPFTVEDDENVVFIIEWPGLAPFSFGG